MSLSFIIPVYNIEIKLIERCLNSLINQIDENDEIIIVDDGSKTEISKSLDAFEQKNIYVLHQKNKGVSSARNLGLAKSSKEWVLFVDPDDYLVDDAICRVKSLLDLNVDYFLFDYKVNDDGVIRDYSFFDGQTVDKNSIYSSLLDDPYYVSNGKSIIWCGVPWAHCYNRKFLVENKILFDEKCVRSQDNIFNMYCTFYAKNIKIVHHAFYIYNFEHCKNFYSKFKPSMLEYLPYLAKVKSDFYYNDNFDSKIKNLLVNFNFMIYLTLSRVYIFSKKNNIDVSERKKYFLDLQKTKEFQIVKDNIRMLSFKKKIFFFLFKMKAFGLLNFIFAIID